MSIRVAHVIDSLGMGGAEHALLNMAPRFKALGIDIVIVPLFSDRTLEPLYLEAGVEVANIHFANKWNILKNIRLLTAFLSSENIQIAHAHLIFSGIYLGLTKLLRLPIIRVISFHNLAYAKGCNPINISYFLRKVLNWFVLRYCYDQILAVSSAVSDHYRSHFGLKEAHIVVLANGLPVDEYYQVTKPAIEGADKPIKIMALGRLVKEKGYNYLLPAFTQLQHSIEAEVELFIVGGGPLDNELKKQAEELDISVSLLFTGPLAHSEAMKQLAGADVYVLPSIFEGFGLAVAEAVLLEVPVVATRVGGVLDIVNEETAVLVEPADSNALAEGIRKVLMLSKGDRRERVKQAKKEVVENYAIEKIARRLSEIYRSHIDLKKDTGQSV